MNKKMYTRILILMSIAAALSVNAVFPQCLPYLGQPFPGMTPLRLVPDSMAANTEWQYHGTPAFSPDGREMYYSIYRYIPGRIELWFTECVDGKWTSPKKAPFSNDSFGNNNPYFSGHKDTMYFLSSRPGGFIFKVTRSNGVWSNPEALQLSIPAGYAPGWQFSIADNKNIYAELSKNNEEDIYVWRYSNGSYLAPVKMTSICSPQLDFTPFIDPEERFIIFASRRPGGYGTTDLYISKKMSDGNWSVPINLGETINSGEVISPLISRDKKYFLFESWLPNSGGGNPYWMDAKYVNDIISDSALVFDVDGNVYHRITIGSQIWLKENLKTTKYKNGDLIPNIPLNSAWANQSAGAYCNYNNNISNADIYGRLYNWYAVNDSRGLAPEGWRVASDSDWTLLTDFLGGESVAGGKLKEGGTTHWGTPNIGATNEVGFTALPGGYRTNSEGYTAINAIGSWWTSTSSTATEAWARGIFNDAATVDRGDYYQKRMGFSVRCIKNESTTDIRGEEDQPATFALLQNYPNPFNPVTVIRFTVARESKVTLKVFGTLGNEVATLVNDYRSAGMHQVTFDASCLAAGLYFYRLSTDYSAQTKKMMLLK